MPEIASDKGQDDAALRGALAQLVRYRETLAATLVEKPLQQVLAGYAQHLNDTAKVAAKPALAEAVAAKTALDDADQADKPAKQAELDAKMAALATALPDVEGATAAEKLDSATAKITAAEGNLDSEAYLDWGAVDRAVSGPAPGMDHSPMATKEPDLKPLRAATAKTINALVEKAIDARLAELATHLHRLDALSIGDPP